MKRPRERESFFFVLTRCQYKPRSNNSPDAPFLGLFFFFFFGKQIRMETFFFIRTQMVFSKTTTGCVSHASVLLRV